MPTRKENRSKAGAKSPATLELLAKVKKADGLTVQDLGGPIESLVEDIVGNGEQATATALIELSHLFQRAEVLCDSDEHTMACLWDAVRFYAFAHSPEGREMLRPHVMPPPGGSDGRT